MEELKEITKKLSSKDFESSQEVRWCPGCGDYSILKQVQTVLPEFGIERHKLVFISGIGCSSRFPYYMNTFGMHSIHGRATAIASGLKAVRPDLHVWIVTGDGDSLSIGGNHTAHLLRRNFNVNILMFNNEIYGLTKGQYSPTSGQNKVTKSTPMGSIDKPFNPLAFALGAEASFVARSMDRSPKHLQEMLRRAQQHQGSSFLEIYQNCNIFNDGAFESLTDKATQKLNCVFLEQGKALRFGENNEKGIALVEGEPKIVDMNEHTDESQLWIHDEGSLWKAQILARFFDMEEMPRPFGVLYAKSRDLYEVMLENQVIEAKAKYGEGDLDALIAGDETWEIS